MQINIHLLGNQISLPIAANETVQGLIYRAISKDPTYSYDMHENGSSFDGRKYKLFTFGELNGKYEIVGNRIIYPGDVRLNIRSADAYLIQLLFDYFRQTREIRLGNNTVRAKSVLLEDTHIFADRILIRTASPITVYLTEPNGHTVYFSPDDPRFCEGIVTNARRKWASKMENDNGFSLRVSTMENAQYLKRATRFKTTFITAWHGPLLLEGSPQVLDFLYQTGLGSKNSQGFGMFDIKHQPV